MTKPKRRVWVVEEWDGTEWWIDPALVFLLRKEALEYARWMRKASRERVRVVSYEPSR